MSVLSDQSIRFYTKKQGMINPFAEATRTPGRVSYGLSSFGYDARLGNAFAVYKGFSGEINRDVINPADFNENVVHQFEAGFVVLEPGSYMLAHTIEVFKMPDHLLGVVLGKSTLARCGILINATPLEPGWEGQITLEIANLSPKRIRLDAGGGICQILFLKGDQVPNAVYSADRLYQAQRGVVLPRGYKGGVVCNESS